MKELKEFGNIIDLEDFGPLISSKRLDVRVYENMYHMFLAGTATSLLIHIDNCLLWKLQNRLAVMLEESPWNA